MWHEGIEHTQEEWWSGWAGFSVLLGFTVMIAVDRLAHTSSSDSNAAGVSAFAGLVLHAAADGIAVGVSAAAAAANTASESASHVEVAILLAIMLHKVPASLGLGTKLLLPTALPADTQATRGQHRQRTTNVVMLIAFALASPVAALLTYAMTTAALQPPSASSGAHLSPVEAQGQVDRAIHDAQPWLGLTFLFAGGTFLHVAVTHGLPAHGHSHVEGHLDVGQAASAGTSTGHMEAQHPENRVETDVEHGEQSPLMGDGGGGAHSPVAHQPGSGAVHEGSSAVSDAAHGDAPRQFAAVAGRTAAGGGAAQAFVEARSGRCGRAARTLCLTTSAAPLLAGIAVPVLLSALTGGHHEH